MTPRARRWLVRGLIGAALAPFVLVALALSALALPLTRAPIVHAALDATNGSLDGTRIELDAVDRLDPWGIELRGVRVFDAERRQIVGVRAASLRMAPLSLTRSTLRVTSASLAGVRVKLYPSPPEPEEEEPETEPSSFQVHVERLLLADAALDMQLSGRALHATIAKLAAGGAYGPRTTATIYEAELAADVDGQRALSLRTTHARWDEQRGGAVGLRGELLDADLAFDAELPPIMPEPRWPLQRADLRLRGLSASGLARVGLADAAQLRAPADLEAHLSSHGERLEAALRLSAGDAQLALNGVAAPGLYSVRARLEPTLLSAVSGVLPELRAGFDLHAELRPDQRPMPVELEWRDVELDGRAVPQGALSAALSLPEVELKRLSLRGFEHSLRLRGKYDLERGAGALELETSALELAQFGGLVPAGLHGTLDGGIHARVEAAALKATAALSLRRFGLAELSVAAADLDLSAAGPLRDPRGELRLTAQQIQSGETLLSRVALRAQAGQRDLSGRLTVEGADRSVALDVLGKRSPDGTLVIDAGGSGYVRDKRLGLKLVELKLGGGAYSVRELCAFSGRERVSASGTLDAQQRVTGSLSIHALDLAPWTRLALDDELSGTLDASARAQGSLQKPSVQAKLSVRGLHAARAAGAPALDVDSELMLEAENHRASLALRAHSADRRVQAELSARVALFKRARDLAHAFERAQVEARLSAHSDVPFAAQFAGDALAQLDGSLAAELRARGTLEAPELDATAGAQLYARAEGAGAPRDRIALRLSLTPQRAETELSVRDRHGELLSVAGEASLPEGGPRALAADSRRLLSAPAKLSLSLAERRLDQLQGALGQLAQQFGFDLPLRAAADAQLESDGSALRASVHARAHVWSKGLDPQCPDAAQLDAELRATLGGERLVLSLSAAPSGGGKAQLELETGLRASALLSGAAFEWGPASVRAQGAQLALHGLPKLCTLPPASTRFALEAADVGKGPLRAKLELDVDQIRIGEGAPLAVQLRAESDAAAVRATGGFKLGSTPRGKLEARVPLAYAAGAQLPDIPRDKPLYAALSLPDFPLSGLTSFTGAVGRAEGSLKGDLRVSGTLAAPEPAGYLELHDAAFSIASLAQPFSGVNGRFELARDKLTIRQLSAHDRSGKLSVKGYARYAPARGGEARIYVSADKFPLRQQGSIVGELTTRAELNGKLDAAKQLALKLDIREGRVWLTGQGGRQVQALDDHPDVRFDAAHPVAAPDAEADAEGAITLSEMRIQSTRDMWLMHEDFSVQVGVDLRLATREERPTLTGQATLTRGELALLGKPFRIQRGAIRFTGDVPPDPELDLKATHTLRKGGDLDVQVQGRASAPQIVFSGAASNAGEAAMLLSGIGASGAESKAKNDAASFAAGLTAGLLAVSARRKFGNWVPMLAIENNASGAPSGARAGFDASALIPKFMQGFARSMYVEGLVGSRADTSSSRGGVGVRVDLALPRDFTTSLGYGPGTTWATDVFWSP